MLWMETLAGRCVDGVATREELVELGSAVPSALAYIELLEQRIATLERANRWKPGERAWYRPKARRSADLPAVILATKGQRVRVRLPSVNGPRVADVAPSSLRKVTSESTWMKQAADMGLPP